MSNKPAIAFKLLTKYIREQLQLATDEKEAVPWVDMPEYKEAKLVVEAYNKIYKKALYLADKMGVDDYDLINSEYNDD